MEEQDGSNIQNSFFNKVRKDRTRVSITLNGGHRIAGFVRSFDRFTLLLDTRQGDQMVFKHAIATVAAYVPREGQAGGGGERRVEERQQEARGFRNMIDFGRDPES